LKINNDLLFSSQYLTVYPELSYKLNSLFNHVFFWSLVGGQCNNILAAYAIYFDISAIFIVQKIFQSLFTFLFACGLIKWMKVIAAKQNVSWIRFDRLSTEEFAALSYIIPLFLSAIFQWLYPLFTGEVAWQNRSQTGVLVHMANIYIVGMALTCTLTSLN
jgi:hypothetical protein